jgi:hypothetical protein
MDPKELDSVKNSDIISDNLKLESNKTNASPAKTQVNVSAAYSYLGELTRYQGIKVSDEFAQAQNHLQRHIAALANEPERALNANPAPTQKPLLEAFTRVINKDENIQEQIANGLTNRLQIVKTSEATETLKSYCDTLPKIFQESNEPGKALMRYMCEIVVNLTTSDNISPATVKQLAQQQIFAPEQALTPKIESVLNSLLGATIDFIQLNQPHVLSSIGRESQNIISPSSTKAQLAEFIAEAIEDLPEENTYLNIFSKKSDNFEDEASREISLRVKELISKAVDIAKESNLIPKAVVSEQEIEQQTLNELNKRAAEIESDISSEKNQKLQSAELENKKIAELAKEIAKSTASDSKAQETLPNSNKEQVQLEQQDNKTPVASQNQVSTSPLESVESDDDQLSVLQDKVKEKADVQNNKIIAQAVAKNLAETILSKNLPTKEELADIDLIKEFENFSIPEVEVKRSNQSALSDEAKKITDTLSIAAAKAGEQLSNPNANNLKDSKVVVDESTTSSTPTPSSSISSTINPLENISFDEIDTNNVEENIETDVDTNIKNSTPSSTSTNAVETLSTLAAKEFATNDVDTEITDESKKILSDSKPAEVNNPLKNQRDLVGLWADNLMGDMDELIDDGTDDAIKNNDKVVDNKTVSQNVSNVITDDLSQSEDAEPDVLDSDNIKEDVINKDFNFDYKSSPLNNLNTQIDSENNELDNDLELEALANRLASVVAPKSVDTTISTDSKLDDVADEEQFTPTYDMSNKGISSALSSVLDELKGELNEDDVSVYELNEDNIDEDIDLLEHSLDKLRKENDSLLQSIVDELELNNDNSSEIEADKKAELIVNTTDDSVSTATTSTTTPTTTSPTTDSEENANTAIHSLMDSNKVLVDDVVQDEFVDESNNQKQNVNISVLNKLSEALGDVDNEAPNNIQSSTQANKLVDITQPNPQVSPNISFQDTVDYTDLMIFSDLETDTLEDNAAKEVNNNVSNPQEELEATSLEESFVASTQIPQNVIGQQTTNTQQEQVSLQPQAQVVPNKATETLNTVTQQVKETAEQSILPKDNNSAAQPQIQTQGHIIQQSSQQPSNGVVPNNVAITSDNVTATLNPSIAENVISNPVNTNTTIQPQVGQDTSIIEYTNLPTQEEIDKAKATIAKLERLLGTNGDNGTSINSLAQNANNKVIGSTPNEANNADDDIGMIIRKDALNFPTEGELEEELSLIINNSDELKKSPFPSYPGMNVVNQNPTDQNGNISSVVTPNQSQSVASSTEAPFVSSGGTSQAITSDLLDTNSTNKTQVDSQIIKNTVEKAISNDQGVKDNTVASTNSNNVTDTTNKIVNDKGVDTLGQKPLASPTLNQSAERVGNQNVALNFNDVDNNVVSTNEENAPTNTTDKLTSKEIASDKGTTAPTATSTTEVHNAPVNKKINLFSKKYAQEANSYNPSTPAFEKAPPISDKQLLALSENLQASVVNEAAPKKKGLFEKISTMFNKPVDLDLVKVPKDVAQVDDFTKQLKEMEKGVYEYKAREMNISPLDGKEPANINNVAKAAQSAIDSNNFLKNISMDDMLSSLARVISDDGVSKEIKQMASSIHQAITNPLGDLQAVSEWLGLVNAPLSATGSRAQAMQQWALMLLSIRFRQLGKNIDKFSSSDAFKSMLNNLSLGTDENWPKNALNQTLTQIERMQQLNRDPDFPNLPSYIPLPPSYEKGREGGINVEHTKASDGEIEWSLKFYFELPNIGPIQIRTTLKMPDVKLNIVTENIDALKRVNETSSYLTDRLKEYGFNVAPIKARLGTIYPPNKTKTTENNITRTRQSNDGLSVDI